mgnify:CR=1 FL=1
MLVKCFFLQGLTSMSTSRLLFTDDLAEVDFLARFDEHRAAVLEVEDTVARRRTRFKGYQAAARTAWDIALPRSIALEDVVHDAVALGSRQEFTAETDEAAGRNDEFQAGITGNIGHVDHFGFTGTEFFHDSAHEFRRNVDGQCFQRFAALAVDFFGNDAGFTDLEFVAFTAHFFDEDGDVEFTTARYFESIGAVRFFDAERYVGLDFAEQGGRGGDGW